jgi:hypothetical protein
MVTYSAALTVKAPEPPPSFMPFLVLTTDKCHVTKELCHYICLHKLLNFMNINLIVLLTYGLRDETFTLSSQCNILMIYAGSVSCK